MYVLGVAFTAFAAGEAVHGSGFMAAFAAGVVVAILDVELCDCFHDYGEATSELFLMFTFVALGTSLIWTGLSGFSVNTLLFAVVALFVRSLVLLIALPRRTLDPHSRRLIVLFGPRALASLLLTLLPVFTGIPGTERLVAPCAFVVVLSVLIHGFMAQILTRRLAATPAVPTSAQPVASPDLAPAANLESDVTKPEAITDGAHPSTELIELDTLQQLQARGEPVYLLDVRKEASYQASDRQARGAVRMPPDDARRIATVLELPKDAWLVAYCA
jgi:sodium/hydrogen antiporter